MFPRASSVPAAALWLSAGGALLGCPQLLEDSFQDEPGLPGTSLDSGGSRYNDPDASVELGGSGGAPGAGGAASDAGSAGNSAGSAAGSGPAGASNGGTTGGSGTPSDAGTPFQPATELGALLLHRYRFNDAGTTITDELGTANGIAVGVAVGAGKISLSADDQYVNLPNGLISSLESVTFEAWVNWLSDPDSPSANWQNIFDFGSSGVEDVPSDAAHSRLYLTARSSVTTHLRAAYTLTDANHEISANATEPLPVSADPEKGTQVVLVVNGALHTLAIYIDGTAAGSASSATISLAGINDINNWIGRSQYDADPEFNGEILDFRIYAAALDQEQVQLSFSLGADANL